jgi:hypothetical protein
MLEEQPVTIRRRLYSPDILLPWRRAGQLKGCALYWLPVKSFPIPESQRAWLLAFLDGLTERLAARFELRCETFLQMSAIYPDLLKDFQNTAMESIPLIGLSWSSSAPVLNPLSKEAEAVRKGEKSFGECLSSYCYWFLNKSHDRWRKMFFGRGGMTLLYMPPDPNIAPPAYRIPSFIRNHPHFQQWDLDGMLQAFTALNDSFAVQSKKLFGAPLKDHPAAKGTLYVLPNLNSQDFLQTHPPSLEQWFQLFQVYLAESMKDQGILLASQSDLDEEILHCLHMLRDRGHKYPEM